MKSSLEPGDIEAIAVRVYELVEPVLSGMKFDPYDKWMNVKELSKYICMSSQWIHNNKNLLPHVNIGNKPLFRKSEIDAWLQQYRVTNREQVQNQITEEPLKNRRFNKQKLKTVTSQ